MRTRGVGGGEEDEGEEGEKQNEDEGGGPGESTIVSARFKYFDGAAYDGQWEAALHVVGVLLGERRGDITTTWGPPPVRRSTMPPRAGKRGCLERGGGTTPSGGPLAPLAGGGVAFSLFLSVRRF